MVLRAHGACPLVQVPPLGCCQLPRALCTLRGGFVQRASCRRLAAMEPDGAMLRIAREEEVHPAAAGGVVLGAGALAAATAGDHGVACALHHVLRQLPAAEGRSSGEAAPVAPGPTAGTKERGVWAAAGLDGGRQALTHPSHAARLRHETRKKRTLFTHAHVPEAAALALESYRLQAPQRAPFPKVERVAVGLPKARVHQAHVLSLAHRDADVRLVEYVEQNPPLRIKPGMAAAMCAYTAQHLPDDVYTGAPPGAGATTTVLHTSLYHAQLFAHRAPRRDFLLVRQPQSAPAGGGGRMRFTLRRLPPAVLLAGHTQPRVALPRPDAPEFAAALQRCVASELAARHGGGALPADCLHAYHGVGTVAKRRLKVAERHLAERFTRDEGDGGRFTPRVAAAAAGEGLTAEAVCELDAVEEGVRRRDAAGMKEGRLHKLEPLHGVAGALPPSQHRALRQVHHAEAAMPWAQTRAFRDCATKGHARKPPALDLARAVLSADELRQYLCFAPGQAGAQAPPVALPVPSDAELLNTCGEEVAGMTPRERAVKVAELRAARGTDHTAFLPVMFAREAAALATGRPVAHACSQCLDDCDDDATQDALLTQVAEPRYTLTVEGGDATATETLDGPKHALWRAYAGRFGAGAGAAQPAPRPPKGKRKKPESAPQPPKRRKRR
eukprot:TRINITY_DN8218_c0_g2_i1.p1 TRINITY_DN8218_c0_g2~~TRINITY_DN8218_c0_g2_i1.p1  ORF type:complete len:670 (+),score=146.52 TRINITY_DN8218_c0_g2_i1:1259-3268(+)